MKGISGKEWVLLSERIKPGEELLAKLGAFKAQILANRGYDERYLDTRLKNLLSPKCIPNIERAVEWIVEAVKRGKRVVLFGDYDVDGITGTALLYDFLKKAGAKVVPLLPSRKRGYGLTRELVSKLERYADLLITIDNGTTAVDELRDTKLPVIVLDHHNPSQELPEALVVNPKLAESLGELKDISSAGLAFYLSALLRHELEGDVDVREYLHLASLGTVADVMPLNPVNRIIVFNGIRLLNYALKGGFNLPGLRLLMERLGMREVNSKDIAFSLAPRLNAPGRIAKPYTALKLLLTKDEKTARLLVERIDRLNEQRKLLSLKALERAIEQAQEQKEKSLLVIKLEEWASGVAGIVAGRLASTFSKPAVVISVGKEHSVASVRAVEGMDIHSALKGLSFLFIKWGGHAGAAGFSIRTQDIPAFERLAEEAFSHIPVEEKALYIDQPLPLSRIDSQIYRELSELEPYGEGFPEPTFLSEPLELKPIHINGQRAVLEASGYRIICWDEAIIKKLSLSGRGGKRVAYQIDRRKLKTLNLVDVEA